MFKKLLMVALFMATMYAQASEPLPPQLSLEGAAPAPAGRFEFAPIPELAFVSGIPETVQLGAFHLDPSNRWAPGDIDRASGWRAARQTRLVDAATGAAPTMLTYDPQTGEVRYAGTWSGDVTLRLETLDGAVRSGAFRARALTPTVVYGRNAASTAAALGWSTAVLCDAGAMSFTTCRSLFKGGGSDGAPFVLFITQGSYGGQDWFLGSRRFVYVLGDPRNRPTLSDDDLSSSKFERWQVRGLNLVRTRIGQASARTDVPTWLIVSNIRQCCETKHRNGISNPHGRTAQPWRITVWGFESKGMGSTGNTMHGMYVEGRPLSTLEVINTRWLGMRGSSAVKTTMQHVSVRHSLFTSHYEGQPTDHYTQIQIDVPGFSDTVVYGNRFEAFREPGEPMPGQIFFRLRQPSLGSDIPAYPDISLDPPESSFTNTTASSPGKGWSKGPETYVADAFWQDVRSQPLDDPTNVLLFRHYVSFNEFVQLPGSAPIVAIRDDGTHPATVVYQFGPTHMLWMHPLAIERSTTFAYSNSFPGYAPDQRRYNLTDSAAVVKIDPGARWPRTTPEEFPRVIDVEGDLPPWFRL